MAGAFASGILAGSVLSDGAVVLSGPGEPLGAFIAALTGIELGRLVSGRTKIDILVTPLTVIVSGSIAGLSFGPPISSLMTALGGLINWGTVQQPFLMGIVAVSYTHLDVYKRQVSPTFRTAANAVNILRQVAVNGIIAVSYTHLDVYKRQVLQWRPFRC